MDGNQGVGAGMALGLARAGMAGRSARGMGPGSGALLRGAWGPWWLLHQAAGGAENHKPSRFTRTDSFTALVEALRPEMASDPVAVTSTGKPGTYVARELVYAYAMWISPAFHLKVIQTFDAVMTGKPVGRTGAEVMAGDVHSGIFLACAQAQQAQVAIN